MGEDRLKEFWNTMLKLCQREGVPQKELEQCTQTIDLIRLLRKERAKKKQREQLLKINKRFKNRNLEQHGQLRKE